MTVVLGPTWAYEQRDQWSLLVTLQWSGLWDVISLQTLFDLAWFSSLSSKRLCVFGLVSLVRLALDLVD